MAGIPANPGTPSDPERRVITLSRESFEDFAAELKRPAKPVRAIVATMKRQAPWERDGSNS